MDTCLLGHLLDPCVGGAFYNGYKLDIADTPGIGADASEDFLRDCELITVG
jgi:hypothetical protein